MSGATSAWHEWVPRLNPEGDQVIYTSSAQGEVGTKMMAVPFEGGAPRAILQDTLIDNNQCARSPSHVCVYSTTIGKKETFYQFDENTGKTKYLFAVASDLVNWSLSPDGTTLAIIENGSNERTIQLRSMSSGKTRLLRVKGWPRIETVDWAYDAKNLFVVTSASAGKSSLLKVTLDGHAKKLREIEDHIINWAIPSPNGHLLAIYESVSVSNAWAVESGLNKRQ